MEYRKLLSVILLTVSLCFVSAVGYGKIAKPREVYVGPYTEEYPDDPAREINLWRIVCSTAYSSILDFNLLKA